MTKLSLLGVPRYGHVRRSRKMVSDGGRAKLFSTYMVFRFSLPRTRIYLARPYTLTPAHRNFLVSPISPPTTALLRRNMGNSPASATPVNKDPSEWRAILSPEQVRIRIVVYCETTLTMTCTQFRILREKGTEPAGTGEYDKHYEEGVYECAGCGTALYRSTTKFKSGCGWPAFYDGAHGPRSHRAPIADHLFDAQRYQEQ